MFRHLTCIVFLLELCQVPKMFGLFGSVILFICRVLRDGVELTHHGLVKHVVLAAVINYVLWSLIEVISSIVAH